MIQPSDSSIIVEIIREAPSLISLGLMQFEKAILPNQEAIARLFDLESPDSQKLITLWKERKSLQEVYFSYKIPEIKDNEDNEEWIELHYDKLTHQETIHHEIEATEWQMAQILTGKASYETTTGLPTIEEINSLHIATLPDRKYILWIMGDISDETLQQMVEDDVRLGKEKPDPSPYLLWASKLLGQKEYNREAMKEIFRLRRNPPQIVTLDGLQLENRSAHEELHDMLVVIIEQLRYKISQDLFPYLTDLFKAHIEKELNMNATNN